MSKSWSRIMEHTSLGAIDPRRWLVLAVVVAAQFMYVVDIFIVNVAIPSIRADLNASTAQIESVIALYQIAYASMVITGGRLGDIYGARRLFLIGLVGFTATSLACGGADYADRRGGPVCRGAGVASPLPITRRGVGSTHHCDIAAPDVCDGTPQLATLSLIAR